MVEPQLHDAPEPVDDEPRDNVNDGSRQFGLIVWAVSSVAFLAYLAFGSVEARMWNFGRLNFEDRHIAHVWSYFGDNLPSMPAQPLFTLLYYVAIVVMVIGTVWGLWFFLSEDDSSPDPAESPGSSPDAHG